MLWAKFTDALRSVLSRDLLVLLVPAGLLPWLVIAWGNYADTFLYRDPAMYQYAAWCMLKGERIYDGIATPDGPVIYMLHAVLQLLVGTGDSAFRKADLVFHCAVSFGTGALLAPRRASGQRLCRSIWGIFHASLWLTFIFNNDFTGSVQREQYYTVLGMAGVVLVYRSADVVGRGEVVMLAAGGFLTAIQLFGKHTGLVYAILGLTTLLLTRSSSEGLQSHRRQRLFAFAFGSCAAVVFVLLFIALVGSLSGFWFWYFRYAFTMYRHWYSYPLAEVIAGRSEFGLIAFTALVAGGAAVGARLLPLRVLPFAIAPILHFGLAVAQSKAWIYQFSTVVGAATVLYTVVLSVVWGEPQQSSVRGGARNLAAVGLLLLVGTRSFDLVRESYWLREDKKLKASDEYNDPRKIAEVLRGNTQPHDRVFFYSRESVIGVLAQRLPAAPYEVPWMLNFHGAIEPGQEFRQPSAEQKARMLQLEQVVQRDACNRIRTNHPAAMIFMDGLPESGADGVKEVVRFCPELQTMLDREYRLADHRGKVRLFLRSDRPLR